MKRTHNYLMLLLPGLILLSVFEYAWAQDPWSASERAALESLWLGNLEALPPDPSNRVADDPRAASMGEKLFFDTRLSSTGQVACGSCHKPELGYQDGIGLGKGVGITSRRTMPATASAYSPFLFWDGRKDSLWAQALGPLESAVEHGGNRAQYAHVIAAHYRQEYESLFGPLPDLASVPRSAGPVEDAAAAALWHALPAVSQQAVTEVFVNIGKAIAAYERGLQFTPSRFDAYVESLLNKNPVANQLFNDDEVAGLRLFIGKANCVQCHNGPLFTNQEFHNTGVPALAGLPADHGRAAGATAVLADEFNCKSRWSDMSPDQCLELDYMVTDSPELERAYKVPTLRNVAGRAPYMHAGQFADLDTVLSHYNKAPSAPEGHSELRRLKLTRRELSSLKAFLLTLDSETSSPAGNTRSTTVSAR